MIREDDVTGVLKWVVTSNKVGDATWFDDDDFDNWTAGAAFKRVVTRALHENFEKYPLDITLPFMWRDSDGSGGPCPDDPVTLYVHLPILFDTDERVIFSCSLEGVVDDVIDGFVNPETGKVVEKEDRETCGLMAKRLRELADKLDRSCEG